MAQEVVDPSTAFAELDSGTPSRIRQRTADILREAVDADASLFCKYSLSEGGEYFTPIESAGSDELRVALDKCQEGARDRGTFWDPRYPPKESEQSFTIQQYDIDMLNEGPDLDRFGDVYREMGVTSEASALLYDGPRFLGWMALFRLRDEPFDEDDLNRLNGLVDTAVRELARADRIEAELLDHPARILVEPGTLEVECATGNAVEWVNEYRRDRLHEELEDLDGGKTYPLQVYIDGFRVWVTQMNGELGPRLLATIERVPSPEKQPEAALTPRQREVVGYAAAGATNREIAETLGITPDTVGDHLSAAYQRLGVANRVELALKLTDSGSGDDG